MSLKSLAVAQYILDKCKQTSDPSVTPMQLIKLVYVAHGYMLGKHGRPLLDEDVQAWQYGPVVPSVYHSVKQYRSSPISGAIGPANQAFSDEEKQVMDLVVKIYGRRNGVELSSATHRPGTPWSKTWQVANHHNAPISNDLIEGFYAGILRQPMHSSL